jgi:hypothetical protein
MTEHCRNWIGDERCGKPAEFIVWGKLFDPDALGPRCYDCAAGQIGHNALQHGNPQAYAVYTFPSQPSSRDEEVRERLLSVGAEAMARKEYELHQEEMGYETVWEEETQGHRRNIYLEAAKERLGIALDAALAAQPETTSGGER